MARANPSVCQGKIAAWLLLAALGFGCTTSARQGLVGEHFEALGSGTPAVSGIRQFHFEFLEQDHHVGRIRLLRGRDRDPATHGGLSVAFEDDSPSDDSWFYSVTFSPIDLDSGGDPAFDMITRNAIEHTAECPAGCLLSVPELLDGFGFALIGFQFRTPPFDADTFGNGLAGSRDRESDTALLGLGIEPNYDTGFVEVTFTGTVTMDFEITIQFVLIPPERVVERVLVEREVNTAGDYEFAESEVRGTSDQRLLSGFRFAKLDRLSDIHLRRIGVNLGVDGPSAELPDGTVIELDSEPGVVFGDSDGEDLIDWKVYYLVVR